MQVLLITVGFVILAIKAAPLVTALVLASSLIVTYVAQITVRGLTGVASPSSEVFRSVGLGLLFMALLAMWQLSFQWHFTGSANVNTGIDFLIAYVAGFMVVMRIDVFPACVVAAVTAVTSVLLFIAAQPLL